MDIPVIAALIIRCILSGTIPECPALVYACETDTECEEAAAFCGWEDEDDTDHEAP